MLPNTLSINGIAEILEATQCGEVIFPLPGGILILGDPLPDAAGFAGIAMMVIGMVGNSLISG